MQRERRPSAAIALVLAFAAACRWSAPGEPAGGARAIGRPLPPGTVYAAGPCPAPARRSPALVLGTQDGGGATAIALTAAQTSVTIDALWVQPGPPADGGTSPVTLTTAANDRGQVRVGFYEEFANGLGPQWRVGVWLAAFVAATTLNRDLLDFTYTAETAGHVDGASASGLMTAAFLAAMTDTAIDGTATMTGVINPDGTIGPVGGIPEKLAGALRAGKRRVGFPVGMRHATDAAGRTVDLIELARDLGGEAVEITDVYAAFELMTGRSLPRPVPVGEDAMAIGPAALAAYAGLEADWRRLLVREWQRIAALRAAGRLPPALEPMIDAAQELDREGAAFRDGGAPTLAYARAVEAWVLAVAVAETAELVARVAAGDLDGARARLQQLEDAAALAERAVREIGERAAAGTADPLDVLAAFGPAVVGLAARLHAGDGLARTRALLDLLARRPAGDLQRAAVNDDVVAVATPALVTVARAIAGATRGMQTLGRTAAPPAGAAGYGPHCPPPDVQRLATSFQSAAAANVSYFEALLGIDDDAHRRAVAGRERDYLIAYTAANLPRMRGTPEALRAAWGADSPAWGLFTLAAEQLAYGKASILISRWYSLRVRGDAASGALAPEHAEAFANMLASAERKAREHARAALVSTGAIPLAARIDYLDARLLAAGDVEHELQALELYWRSSGTSQLAAMLARP